MTSFDNARPRGDSAFFGRVGHLGMTLSHEAGSQRLRETLRNQDVRSEKSIAGGQALIACFVIGLHLVAQANAQWRFASISIVGLMALLVATSLVRWRLAAEGKVPDRLLDALNVADIGIFLAVIWIYHTAYAQPAGSVLQSPSFALLCVLVALRALRFHPRAVLASGATATFGWMTLTAMAISVDGSDAITHDYVDYITSNRILIGAEVERLVSLIALTALLGTATYQGRWVLSRAADANDYAEALHSAERHLDETKEARRNAERALHAVAERDKALSRQVERFNVALDNMSQGLCMFDANMKLVVCNGRYIEMYGLPEYLAEPGTSFRRIIEHRVMNGIFSGRAPEEYVEERLAAVREGKASTKIQKLSDGRVVAIAHRPMSGGGWVATHEDITELQRVQEQIAHMAHHDALTDLPNRLLLRERLDQAVMQARRGQQFAVLCLDLDRFKNVNDTLGHPIGDQLLIAVAARLRDCIREIDTVARLGGDEFAIVQVSNSQPHDATALASRIGDVLREPFDLDGHHVVIDASIGIAIVPADGLSSDEVLRNADMALYRAKGDGRGVHRFFEPAINERMQARRKLELDLRRALERQEFELHYQPVVAAATGDVLGFEALLRWHHPERGTIPPAEFIPIAEEIGLIIPIGEWVIRTACQQASKWPRYVRVAVNLSPVQFRSDRLVQAVFSALASTQMAGRLDLEITEAVLLDNTENTLSKLHELRALGARIVMDDFGTGYCSLSYLRSFPFDKIKLDGSFVRDLASQQGAGAIIEAVAVLSRSLGIVATAEGVETPEQLAKVRAAGYAEIQGFLFSPPLSAEALERRYYRNNAMERIPA